MGGSSTTRKRQGLSRGKGLDVLLENGERILISFTEEEGRPQCAYACKFASEFGVAVILILDHLFFTMEMTNCDHLISS